MNNEDHTLDWDKELIESIKIFNARSPLQRAEMIIEFYMQLDNHTPELKDKFRDYLKSNLMIVFQTRAIDKLMDSTDEFDDKIFGVIFQEAEDLNDPVFAELCIEA